MRVSFQYLQPYCLQIKCISKQNLHIVQMLIVYVQPWLPKINSPAGTFHQIRKRLPNVGSSRTKSTIVIFLRRNTVLHTLQTQQRHPFRLFVEALVTQFISNLRKKKNAHQQAQGQREEFDEISPATAQQCLYRII